MIKLSVCLETVFTLLLEPLNSLVDHGGYFLDFHSAGVPGRGELFGGELDHPSILKHLERLGYEGCFGLEHFPRIADHEESLKQIRAVLEQASPQ